MNSVIQYSLNAYWIRAHYAQSSALSTGKTAMNKIDQNSCPHGAKYSYGRETGIEDQRDFINYYIWKFNIMRCLPHKTTYIKKLSTCWYIWFYFRNKTSSDHFIQPVFVEFLLCAMLSSRHMKHSVNETWKQA